MEEVFKGMADMLGRFKGIEQLADEGLKAINTALKGQELTEKDKELISEAKAEVNEQLKNYRKVCQSLSQIENTRG
jgi:hypothetical protein